MLFAGARKAIPVCVYIRVIPSAWESFFAGADEGEAGDGRGDLMAYPSSTFLRPSIATLRAQVSKVTAPKYPRLMLLADRSFRCLYFKKGCSPY